jgi:pullulanase
MSYNWGYDPENFNVPEGSFSRDPYHGEVRIRECKQMIQALHRAGIGVIMDVVYNHTYRADSWLERTVPGYYYRHAENGDASNGSGCGNDIATERSMCAKYILDSVLYWVEQYHMDGFRFDLMGLVDMDLMNAVQETLDQRYGVGEKLVYGEPWRGGTTWPSKPVTLCDKGSLKTISGRIGAFCDDTRDAVKGSLMDLGARGFVNGGGIHAYKLHHCLTGWAGGYGAFQTPYQTITYLSCHDDWTLWDKLVSTMDAKKNYTGSQKEVQRANRLAAAINFCCQGRPFFLAGEEFGRTKGGIKNSFCSSSEVNELDWNRAYKNRELVDYYRGLIALRMQMPGVQDKTRDAAKRILWVKELAENCVMASVDNKGGKWEKLILIFNCSDRSGNAALPHGNWQILADGENSFRWQKEDLVSEKVNVAEHSAMILGSK